MHVMVIAVLLAAAAANSVARPPGPSEQPGESYLGIDQSRERSSSALPSRDYLLKYLMPKFLPPGLMPYGGNPRLRIPPSRNHGNDWLNKEIDRINHMEQTDDSSYYDRGYPRFSGQTPYMQRIFQDPVRGRELHVLGGSEVSSENAQIPSRDLVNLESDTIEFPIREPEREMEKHSEELINDATKQKKMFALTPLDEGYFEPDDQPTNTSISMPVDGAHEGGGGQPMELLEPPRQIRQNPNLSKTKTLVAENLDKFKSSLSQETSGGSDNHINMREPSPAEPTESIYGIALIAAIGAAFTMAILVFAFGWYTLSKKAKAAADVDYPAYGVTGPTVDTSGDRKLAHSAHMYHYQHQKQQILAMERNGLEQRNGSMSDPDSEEENEEGDYTVYECPGFATTGDMEVKNPMFAEDPTPATPGKRDITKTEPKE